jgi:hypothetical protein
MNSNDATRLSALITPGTPALAEATAAAVPSMRV